MDDEPASLLAGRHSASSGPWSVEEVLSAVARRSPEQALGWPLLLSAWGRVVGWSEVAVRALSLFFGMLTLAWVYRTGRDLLAPRAGLFATLLLSTSVFFLAYMIHARAFTLIALCSTLCIWSYWRLVLHPRPTGIGAPAGLMLGSDRAYSIRTTSARCFCLPSASFTCSSCQRAAAGGGPSCCSGWLPCWPLLQLPGFLRGLEDNSFQRGSAQPGPLCGRCSRASGSLPEQWPYQSIPTMERAPASRPACLCWRSSPCKVCVGVVRSPKLTLAARLQRPWPFCAVADCYQ